MADISVLGVVGTDGVVPIYQPEARWCWWSLNEIFTGGPGDKRYIPKVKDYVVDPDNYTTYIVEEIEPVTLIPKLRLVHPANMTFDFTETDVLFGVGPGTQADTYRVYLDTSVTPHVLAVDARLKIGGTMSKYVKLFRGSDLSGTGKVISYVYDASGQFISHNVPLELVAIDSHVNYAIKTVGVCYTNEEIPDGEVITAVVYNDEGHVVSKRQLLLENTSFIRSLNDGQKFVSHISLECPFMSPTLDHVIDFPLNVPTNALNLMGVVHYSDGSTIRLPVDGTKFRIFGLDQYVSTIVGQKAELVLSYALSSNESAYGAVSSDGKYITEPYSLVTVKPNNAYTVKVFGYPVWIDQAQGYRMKWFLFNLDRNISFDVTAHVKFAASTGSFDPKGYGYLQRKAITLNLRDVSGSFRPYIHTQLVDIVLREEAQQGGTPWTVSHESIGERPPYGDGVIAIRNAVISQTSTILDIKSGASTKEEWLNKIYYQTYPLVDRFLETTPPTPTHFELSYGSYKSEFSVDAWSNNISLGFNLPFYSTVFLKFFKRTAAGDIQLATSAMLVR